MIGINHRPFGKIDARLFEPPYLSRSGCSKNVAFGVSASRNATSPISKRKPDFMTTGREMPSCKPKQMSTVAIRIEQIKQIGQGASGIATCPTAF